MEKELVELAYFYGVLFIAVQAVVGIATTVGFMFYCAALLKHGRK